MSNYIVRIDDFSDSELEYYGWIRTYTDSVFSLYWHPGYGEYQPVSNIGPRFLIIDDRNDAEQMARGPVLKGPD